MTIKSLIPAERWEDMTAIYSAHRATEQKGADPVSVSAAVYGSYLYTAFGVIHRPWGYLNQPTIMAWRLVPLDLYKGETTTLYHDAQAIKQGLRERGDHTGLVVRHKGDLLVCTTPVELRCDLPVKHLSLDEAKAHDQHERGYAWRSILFGSNPEHGIHWRTLLGHPVVEYRGESRTARVLYWRHKGEIKQLWLEDDMNYSRQAFQAMA